MRVNAGRMLGRHSVSVRGRGHRDWGDDGRERDSPVPLFDSQTEEADRLYDGLEAGGEAQPCGWLKDRFGASWQIVPDALGRRLRGRDPNRVKRVIRVLLEMKKIDIAALKRAYIGSRTNPRSEEKRECVS